jgi:hypothetical protein
VQLSCQVETGPERSYNPTFSCTPYRDPALRRFKSFRVAPNTYADLNPIENLWSPQTNRCFRGFSTAKHVTFDSSVLCFIYDIVPSRTVQTTPKVFPVYFFVLEGVTTLTTRQSYYLRMCRTSFGQRPVGEAHRGRELPRGSLDVKRNFPARLSRPFWNSSAGRATST